MKFNTGSLPLGEREFSFVESSDLIGLDDRFFGDVKVLARVEKTAQMIVVNAAVSAQANLLCDRCAEEYTADIRTKYTMVYLFHEDEQGDYKAEEVVILPSEHAVIDISDDVRQFILLRIPFKLLCKEDCKGLCPRCGTNRNIASCTCDVDEVDPRWEQLKKLTKEN
jgi:uncharacterized protein